MSTISEGLSVGGDTGEATAESLLAQQETRERTAASHGLDEAQQTDDELRAEILAADEETSIIGGLVEDTPEARKATADALYALSDTATRVNSLVVANLEQEARDAAELQAFRDNARVEQALDVLVTPEDSSPEELAAAWASLSLEEKQQAVSNGFVDEDAAPVLDAYAEKIDTWREQVKGALHTAALGLQHEQGRSEAWSRIQDENPELREGPLGAQLLNLADADLRRATNGAQGLASLDPFEWNAHVRGRLGMLREEVKANRDAAEKAAIFFEPTGDVASGLEVMTPNGWQRTQPAPHIAPKPNFDRAVAFGLGRDNARYESDEAIRASVAEPVPTSVASGLTVNGRPVAISDVVEAPPAKTPALRR